MARKITRGRLTNHMLVVAYRYHAIFHTDKPSVHDLDLYLEWHDFTASRVVSWATISHFGDHVRSIVSDPLDVDEFLTYCEDCAHYHHEDDLVWLDPYDKSVCESCADGYPSCNDCGDRVHTDYLTWVNDERVCESCLDYNYSYCDGCDEYYYSRDGGYCCDDNCDCESPMQKFSIRNDGLEPLANDTRTTLTLAAGVISEEGLLAINRLLHRQANNEEQGAEPPYWITGDDGNYVYDDRGLLQTNPEYEAWRNVKARWYNLANDVYEGKIGNDWQTRDGNFTKRLSRYAYKTYGVKITPEVISEVGNIGSQHSQGATVNIEVTRDLNLPAYEFAHEDSCWWQSYYEGRCSLKSNGGFGLRSFNSYGVTGRAWVMPLKRKGEGTALEPTFDTMDADAFVVFNGYGDLNGYTPARIMAHMSGMTYRKVTFFNSPMYVNGDMGYLVAPEEIADAYTDGTLQLHTSTHSSLYSLERAAGKVAAA